LERRLYLALSSCPFDHPAGRPACRQAGTVALALRIDPWASEYESALQIDEEPEDHASVSTDRRNQVPEEKKRDEPQR